MPARPQSLRRQLLTWLLALLIPLLVLGAFNSYIRAFHFANLAYDRTLFRAALALADQVEVVTGSVSVDLPQKALDLLEYDKDDWVYYRVSDQVGRTVTGEPRLPLPARLPPPGGHLYYDAKLGDKELRLVVFVLPLTGTSAQGTAIIQVAETRAKRDFVAEEIIAAMMLPQLLIVLLAGVLVHYGVRRGLAPLERLREAFAQRSHRDLSAVPYQDTPREVQPMLQAVNDLLQRLRDAIAQQERFIADASHQLRTPLAGLRTQAELALRASEPAQIRHGLEQISASSMRLSHLVQQLLTLARMEPGAAPAMAHQPIDIVQLARETTADWVGPALSKEIDLGFDTQQNGMDISGNALMLREMLSNLLDNAIRYTPRQGRITVRLARTGDSVILSVEDNGPGIPAEARDTVFDRFHRLPDSPGDGCGLGLAIVREVALVHNAEILLKEGAEGRGTCIEVQFPSLPAAS